MAEFYGSDGVALGAAGDELHIGLRAGAGGADLLPGAGAVGVGAVAGDLFKVGLGQLLQNGGMCTLAVVVFKIQHGKTLLYIIVRKQYLYSTSLCKPCQTQNRAQRTQGTAKALTGYPVRHYVDRNYSLRQLFLRKYDPFQKDEKFFKKVLDNSAASGIITIVPGATAQEHNRICGYGGIGRRVRFRF